MRTEMQARLGQMLEEYQATRSRLGTLSAELAAITATARSADRTVTATVNPPGELVELTIDPVLGARLDLKMLSARILEASGLAATQVREQVRGTMRGALPDNLRNLVGPDGAIDVQRLLPTDPTDLLGGGRR
jgi:DNA-binding protein YbaB